MLQVDLYAVGAIAYEFIYGRPPFYRRDRAEKKALILKGNLTFGQGASIMAQVRAPFFDPCRCWLIMPYNESCVQQFIMKAMSSQPALRGTAGELLQHPWIVQSCCGDINTMESNETQHRQVSGWGRTQASPETATVQHGVSQYKKSGMKSLAPELTGDGRPQHPVAHSHRTLSRIPVKDGLLHSKTAPGKSGGSHQVQISMQFSRSRQAVASPYHWKTNTLPAGITQWPTGGMAVSKDFLMPDCTQSDPRSRAQEILQQTILSNCCRNTWRSMCTEFGCP